MCDTKYMQTTHSQSLASPRQSQTLTPTSYHDTYISYSVNPYNLSTVTPVSIGSPNYSHSTDTDMSTDREVKLSPGGDSSSPHPYLTYGDDYHNAPFARSQPMKHKSPSRALGFSSLDNSFPPSPAYACPPPFYGSYGVSAPPVTAQSTSSMNLDLSPRSTAAYSIASSPSLEAHSTTGGDDSNYASKQQDGLIPIAPHLVAKRGTAQQKEQQRQSQVKTADPNQQVAQAVSDPVAADTTANQGSDQYAYDSRSSNRFSKKVIKGKSTCRDLRHVKLGPNRTLEENVLISLRSRENAMTWKEVAQAFNDATGKKVQVAALQMKEHRMLKRLRKWTAAEERALELAYQDYQEERWEKVAELMAHHGCTVKWSKEACENKFYELHPSIAPPPPPQQQQDGHHSLSADYEGAEDWEEDYADEAVASAKHDHRVVSSSHGPTYPSAHAIVHGHSLALLRGITAEDTQSQARRVPRTSDPSGGFGLMRQQQQQQPQGHTHGHGHNQQMDYTRIGTW